MRCAHVQYSTPARVGCCWHRFYWLWPWPKQVLACKHCQVMEPVRSRCLCVRVPGPSNAQIQEQLALVARKESLALPAGLSERVALLSHRNLRRALLTLEVAYVQTGGPLDGNTKVQPPDWELYAMVSAAGVQRELCNALAGRRQTGRRSVGCVHSVGALQDSARCRPVPQSHCSFVWPVWV